MYSVRCLAFVFSQMVRRSRQEPPDECLKICPYLKKFFLLTSLLWTSSFLHPFPLPEEVRKFDQIFHCIKRDARRFHENFFENLTPFSKNRSSLLMAIYLPPLPPLSKYIASKTKKYINHLDWINVKCENEQTEIQLLGFSLCGISLKPKLGDIWWSR